MKEKSIVELVGGTPGPWEWTGGTWSFFSLDNTALGIEILDDGSAGGLHLHRGKKRDGSCRGRKERIHEKAACIHIEAATIPYSVPAVQVYRDIKSEKTCKKLLIGVDSKPRWVYSVYR